MDGDSLLLDQSCGVIPVCGLLLASLLLHVPTNLDLERHRLRNLTVKRLRTAVQHVITAVEKEARLIHEGETKSDAGQTDQKSSENIREM